MSEIQKTRYKTPEGETEYLVTAETPNGWNLYQTDENGKRLDDREDWPSKTFEIAKYRHRTIKTVLRVNAKCTDFEEVCNENP